MNKKGDTELLSREVMFMIFVALVAVILAAFIYNQSRGYGMKEQYLSKQLALMIDSAQPGTEIKIDVKDILRVSVDDSKKEVFVQASERSSGKRYPYFSSHKVTLIQLSERVIKLEIGEKDE